MISLFCKHALCILLLSCYYVDAHSMHVATTIPRKVENILKKTNVSNIRQFLNNSRRIVVGTEALESRPYMVYLKLPSNNPKYNEYRRWLCGGVIIHEEYILTSAACIEDAKHFYVVSGTYVHDDDADRYNNQCIKNGAKKAVWKCVPRNYVFDGHENDNIRWMNNDIAIVKTEDEFDFTRRVRGCEFIPRPICYNNQTQKLEEPDNMASIAGWGSTARYNEPATGDNKKHQLLEAAVRIISKTVCKKRWGKRYHNVIDNYMICTKDVVPDLSELCSEKYVDCTDIQYEDDEDERRRVFNPEKLQLHSAYHNETALQAGFRKQNYGSGGFCENDHGGPLVYGTGTDSMVIGIISACLVKEGTNRCYGPFLYTSVWRNRILINCAIYKNSAGGCDKLFRAGGTHTEVIMKWSEHPDGPAKNEVNSTAPKSNEEVQKENKESEKEPIKKAQKEIEPIVKAPIEPQKEIQPIFEETADAQKDLEPKLVEAPLDLKDNMPKYGKPSYEENEERRQFDNSKSSSGTTTLKMTGATSLLDKALEHSGIVLRTFEDSEPNPNKSRKSKLQDTELETSLRSIKLSHKSGKKNAETCNYVLEVSGAIRKALIVNDRVFINWSSCPVRDFTLGTRCYECQQYGHAAKTCRESIYTCGHCGNQGHSIKDCAKREGPKCATCLHFKKPSNHITGGAVCPARLLAEKR